MPKWIAGRQKERERERGRDRETVLRRERDRGAGQTAPFGGHVHGMLHGN